MFRSKVITFLMRKNEARTSRPYSGTELASIIRRGVGGRPRKDPVTGELLPNPRQLTDVTQEDETSAPCLSDKVKEDIFQNQKRLTKVGKIVGEMKLKIFKIVEDSSTFLYIPSTEEASDNNARMRELIQKLEDSVQDIEEILQEMSAAQKNNEGAQEEHLETLKDDADILIIHCEETLSDSSTEETENLANAIETKTPTPSISSWLSSPNISPESLHASPLVSEEVKIKEIKKETEEMKVSAEVKEFEIQKANFQAMSSMSAKDKKIVHYNYYKQMIRKKNLPFVTVRNLPSSASEQDISEIFLSVYQTPTEILILKNKRHTSSGYAVVFLKTRQACNLACSTLNEVLFQHCRLQLKNNCFF